MRSGRWTPPRRSRWPTAVVSPGCDSPTSAAGRSSGPRFSPQANWSEVPPQRTQAELRRAFEAWGLPERFRVDNGTPWGSWGELPCDLALWLKGLGVGVDWNPPRTPQDNGVIERSQGTGKRWAEPGACQSVEELQRRIEEMDVIQRDEYPAVRGCTRREAFPDVSHSGRPYESAGEAERWSLEAVTSYLAGYAIRRRVDKSGMVSVYNKGRYVGILHIGKHVHVSLDPIAVEWIFADDSGCQLRSLPASEISRESIIGLEVTHRR